MNRQFHIQTLLFLLLFLIFVIGSFFIVSSEIQGYQNIHKSITLEDDLSTPLAYLNTKIKSYDQKDMIEIVTLEKSTCLKLSDNETSTYIFYKNGYLQEVTVSFQYVPSLDEAEKLFALDDMQVTINHQMCAIMVKKSDQMKRLSLYLHG